MVTLAQRVQTRTQGRQQDPSGGPRTCQADSRWRLTKPVISNMVTSSFPMTAFNAASHRMFRLFAGFCRLRCLMYSQSFLMASVRGRGSGPTMAARAALGRKTVMKAVVFFGVVVKR